LVLTLAGFLAGFNGMAALMPVAGLMQRIFIVVGWGWLAALGAYMLRAGSSVGR
jgi:hypothetical protein